MTFNPYVTLAHPSREYVAWIDVMGFASAMARSLSIAANFMLKFQNAVLTKRSPGVVVYPIMDGVFATAKDAAKKELGEFIVALFQEIAALNLAQSNNDYFFIIRGSLARGSLYHGRDLSPTFDALDRDDSYRSQLLLGRPMVTANKTETLAAPYGMYVDDSCNGVAKEFRWWRHVTDATLAQRLLERLHSYFDACAAAPAKFGYPDPTSKIPEHRRRAVAFLNEPAQTEPIRTAIR